MLTRIFYGWELQTAHQLHLAFYLPKNPFTNLDEVNPCGDQIMKKALKDTPDVVDELRRAETCQPSKSIKNDQQPECTEFNRDDLLPRQSIASLPFSLPGATVYDLV